MKHPRKPLRILYVLIGAFVSLLMVAGMALAFYVFFDWYFVFVVVPIAAVAALLTAGALNWWSKREDNA